MLKEFKVFKERLVPQVQLELKVYKGKPEPRETKVYRVRLVPKEYKVSKVKLETQEPQELLEIQGPKVYKV